MFSVVLFNMPEQKFPNTCISSIRKFAAFFLSGRLDTTLALGLGAILSSEITNKKHKNVKNMVKTTTPKNTYFLSAEISTQTVDKSSTKRL
jgi:hypothetical protein